jgi:hypothetical protein
MIRYPDTMSAARLWVVALLGAAASGCAARQAPRPTVVVLEVKGAADPVWQTRVAELAEARRLDVIPAERYWVTATRLRARPLTARNVARVAGILGATAVVHGRMTGGKRHRKSRRQVVTLYVRDGESGRVVEKHRLLLRRGQPSRRGEAALERRLLASVAPEPEPEAPPRRAPEAPPRRAPEAPPAPPPSRAKVVEAKPKPAGKARSARAPDPAPAPPVVYDEKGQAIDEEAPPPR